MKRRKLKIILIMLIIMAIFILGKVQINNSLANENMQKSTDIVDGKNSYISSVGIIQIVTGTGPFDTLNTTDSISKDGTVKWTAGDDISI